MAVKLYLGVLYRDDSSQKSNVLTYERPGVIFLCKLI